MDLNTAVPTPSARSRLLRRLKRAHLDPAPDVVEGLVIYFDLLQRWNQKINLTALTDPDEAIDRLLLEPLLASRLLPEPVGVLVDIGSGGGSPAIPMKLAAPTSRLWMIESKTRKSAFLREVVRELGLDGTFVETRRFEEVLQRTELLELVDVVSMRAVRADLKTLAALQSFLRPEGQLFFFSRVGVASTMMLPPQLTLLSEDPLLPALQSCLVRLVKRGAIVTAH